MTKKFQNITNKLAPVIAVTAVIILWAVLSSGIVPSFMLPTPYQVASAFCSNFSVMLSHGAVTLTEALAGLGIGIILAFVTATLMDKVSFIEKAFYPILVISQTIPTIAIAPLLVLWMGFGMAPKITLVVLTTFFPITIGLLDGYKSVDKDAVNLLKSMGAKELQIFIHAKFPASLGGFFSGLKVSASYAVVGAVISEWLGGFEGLGVFMTRVKKAYAFDSMFAVIIFICVVSLLLMGAVKLIERFTMPWKRKEKVQ